MDSVKYWASEYKLDGFRFDLMGLMDIDLLPGVSMFNNQFRDGIKGSVFDKLDRGYATGSPASINSVMAGCTDAVNSPKWGTKASNITTYKYFKGLIALCKAQPCFSNK